MDRHKVGQDRNKERCKTNGYKEREGSGRQEGRSQLFCVCLFKMVGIGIKKKMGREGKVKRERNEDKAGRKGKGKVKWKRERKRERKERQTKLGKE